MEEDAPDVTLQATYWTRNIKRNNMVALEQTERQRHIAVRLPFELLEIRPQAGHALGLALVLTDEDNGGKRALRWGPSVGSEFTPRLLNEIILGD